MENSDNKIILVIFIEFQLNTQIFRKVFQWLRWFENADSLSSE